MTDMKARSRLAAICPGMSPSGRRLTSLVVLSFSPQPEAPLRSERLRTRAPEQPRLVLDTKHDRVEPCLAGKIGRGHFSSQSSEKQV